MPWGLLGYEEHQAGSKGLHMNFVFVAEVDPDAVERFWSTRGWTRIPVDMRWSFASRADLEAVVRIEFAPAVAEAVLAGHSGTEVDYAVNVWWRSY